MPDPFIDAEVTAGHRDSPLSVANVERVFGECMSYVTVDADGALGEDAVSVQGVVHTVVFNRSQLDKHRREIGGMLAQLPTEFQPYDRGGGGGWSFLNACNDRDGNQWTGLHLVMEQLFLLGIATGQAAFLLSRDLWPSLPGGMPYVAVVADAG